MVLRVTESCELRHSALRLFALAGVCIVLVCAFALVAVPSLASSSTQPRVAAEKALPIPGAFRLPASNGYSMHVIAVPPGFGRSAFLLIIVSGKGGVAQYVAPATVTETSMHSDLGELGEISVSFHRTNRATSAPCGKKKVRFDSGQYEGKIDFHGEEGYTSVEAAAAPGDLDYFLSLDCLEGFAERPNAAERARGAELNVRNPGLGPELSVSKERPEGGALILVFTREYSNGISIQRSILRFVPRAAFRYDRRLRTAIVRPPAPFAGSARFDFDKKAGQRWNGNLTVDLPGKAGVPLTGPTLRAVLVPDR
jgi:hypothetical protein